MYNQLGTPRKNVDTLGGAHNMQQRVSFNIFPAAAAFQPGRRRRGHRRRRRHRLRHRHHSRRRRQLNVYRRSARTRLCSRRARSPEWQRHASPSRSPSPTRAARHQDTRRLCSTGTTTRYLCSTWTSDHSSELSKPLAAVFTSTLRKVANAYTCTRKKKPENQQTP